MMQAVILAGGLGTRLWPLTREVPKPMVPVAGVPYLEHQLRLLREQQFDDIVLLTGYLGEQIEQHFADGARLGLSIRYSRETDPLGTGGALREAGHLLADRFLLIYGDSYLPIRYAGVLDSLSAHGTQGAMAVYDNALEDTDVNNNIALDKDGYVIRYDKQAADDPQLTHVEAGVLAFDRSILQRLPAAGKISLEQQIFPQLIADRQLIAFPTRQRFYDIGTPDRLRTIAGILS